jgi:hypothetical protein
VPSLRVEKKAKTELRHAQYQLGKWALCHTRTASASGAAFVRPRFPNYTTGIGCMDCAGRDSAFAMRRCFSYIWLMDPACISSLLVLLLLTIPSRLPKRSGCFASPYSRTATSRIAAENKLDCSLSCSTHVQFQDAIASQIWIFTATCW